MNMLFVLSWPGVPEKLSLLTKLAWTAISKTETSANQQMSVNMYQIFSLYVLFKWSILYHDHLLREVIEVFNFL